MNDLPSTLFMIHGMWGGAWCWDNTRRVLEAEGWRCVAPTLPYHDVDPRAAPDPRLGATSLLDYAAFLEAEIGKLGGRPVIVGHSMGGLLAQMLAARGLARALVLLTPAWPAGIQGLRPSVLRSFLSAFLRWGVWKRPMRQTYGEAVYSMMALVAPQVRRPIYERFVYESGRAACEIGYWFLDPRRASRVDAARVTCPVLVVAGTQDRITPAAVVRRVARKYAAVSTYREFADHAHWVLGEPGWEDVARFVADWMKRLPPVAAPA